MVKPALAESDRTGQAGRGEASEDAGPEVGFEVIKSVHEAGPDQAGLKPGTLMDRGLLLDEARQ